MNLFKHPMLGRFALALTFLCCFTVSHAQWDYEYQIGVTMTQKPYSNSLTEVTSGIYGVTNDLNGIGFWIHMTDGNGKTTASFYYKTNAGTLRAHAIEVWGTTIFTAGEIDYGNGTTDVFLMSSDATGGVNNAAFVPFGTNTVATAVDLVITASTGTTADLLAVGYIDKTTSKVPCSVMFDNSMSSFASKEYDPGTGEFLVPTQAKLLDPTYAPNRVIVVGNDEDNPNGNLGIFKMKINTTNGNQAGSFRRHYIGNDDLFNPSVSATIGTNNVLIAATYGASTSADAVIMRFAGSPGVNPSIVRQYDKNGGDESPIQIHESSIGNAVLAYNFQSSAGTTVPAVARISLTMSPVGTIVVSDLEYLSQHNQRRMHTAFARNSGSSTMYFECITPKDDVTRTVASSSVTPCEVTADFDYTATPSITSPNLTGTTTSSTIYDDLTVDESDVTGSRYDCDGNFDGSFKKSPTSIASLDQEKALVSRLAEGVFVIQADDIRAYTVYDINGQVILDNSNSSKGSEINLQTLPMGIYILSASSTDGAITQVKLQR